ncbi:MAG TPA: MBG domain-containing protein [Gammaproteobacteria bacterium]|nr:MBG domain-containing protein [Gammaproteobacteria bacterium]
MIINKLHSLNKPFLNLFSKRVAALLFSFSVSTATFANPVLDNVGAGNVSIQQTQSTTVVNQASHSAVVNWQSFNIGANESTHFQQPTGGIILNRINPQAGASQIYGHLTATGQVILSNAAGIYFGPSAYVNVGGLIATTAHISDQHFMDGQYQFDYVPGYSGAIVNEGQIIVAEHGLAALVAAGVVNHGTIQANLGKVVLASGEAFTMDFAGDQLINFAVTQKTSHRGVDKDGNPIADGVKNTGAIYANGGQVIVSAKAASGVLDHVINLEGVVEAKSVHQYKGEIILSGDQDAGVVRVAAKVNASGKQAGEKGGTVNITGYNILLDSPTTIDVSGDIGGGDIHIGGNYLGQGPLANANALIMLPNTTLLADALTTGNGGEIILWSKDMTYAAGDILTRGGAQGGDGGFIETSSQHYLDVNNVTVDTSAPNGNVGTWLLDPTNIWIANSLLNATIAGMPGGNQSANNSAPPDFVASGAVTDSYLSTTTIINALASNNVSVNATNASGGGAGNITVVDAVTWSNGNDLTFNAPNNIDVRAPLGSTNSGAVLTFDVGGSMTQASSSGIFNLSASIVKKGSGTATFSQQDLYTGSTDIQAGTLSITAISGFANTSSITVESGATLSLSANVSNSTHTLFLNGTGVNNSGALVFTGTVTALMPITIQSDASIGGTGASGTATISGAITGTGVDLAFKFPTMSLNIGNITLDGSTTKGSLNVTVGGTVTVGSSSNITVNNYNLLQGTWSSISATLPTFRVVNNFQIESGSINANAMNSRFTRATSGDGSTGTPYLISDVYGLQGINSNDGTTNNLAKSFSLNNDIDASSTVYWNSGAGFVPIGNLTNNYIGQFNGQLHRIDGLYINAPATTTQAALFGSIGGAAIISNVGVTNAEIHGAATGVSTARTAVLVGETIASGSVWTGSITKVFTTGVLTAVNGDAGGLVARAGGSGTITIAFSSVAVAMGDVVGFGSNVGGLIGRVAVGVTNAYSTGPVTMNSNDTAGNTLGGFAGAVINATIDKSYSTGYVAILGTDTSTDIGGFVGNSASGSAITGSFWGIGTSGKTAGRGVGLAPTGLFGGCFGNTSCGTATAGTATNTTTYDLTLLATYTGAPTGAWANIANAVATGSTWNIVGSSTYPYFSYFYPTTAGRSISGTISGGSSNPYLVALISGGSRYDAVYSGNNSFYYFLTGASAYSVSGLANGAPILTYVDGGDIKASTVGIAGASNASTLTLNLSSNNVLLGKASGSTSLSVTDMSTAKGSFVDTDILYTITSGVAVNSNANLQSPSGTTFTIDNHITLSGTGVMTLTGPVTLGGSTPTLTLPGTTNTISGAIGGTGGFTKAGAGNLILSNGANNYSGTATINAGTLTIGASNALPANPVVIANAAGATLSLLGTFTDTIGSLSGGGNLGGTISLGAGSVLTIQQTSSLAYDGVFSGTGSLTKSGSSTLTLSRSSGAGYTGAVNVNVGTLSLTNAGALGTSNTSAMTIANNAILDVNISSATLGATGTINLNGVGSGSGALTLTGSNTTINNPINLQSSSTIGGNATGTQIFGGAISGAGTDLTVNLTGGGVSLSAITLTAASNLSVTAAGGITLGNAINSGSGTVLLNASGALTANSTIATTNTGNGSSSAIILKGSTFVNGSGSATPFTMGSGGRFLIYSVNPASDTRGTLAYNFKQYNISYATAPTSTTGNGLLYTVAPTITPSLIGTVSKSYTGTNAATLAAGNYSSSGAIDGDTVSLNNPTSGTYGSVNVGTNINVAVSGIAVASATNGAVTVYGYQIVPTANANIGVINPASLTITANNRSKSYGQTVTFAGTEFTPTGLQNGETVGSVSLGSSGAVATAGVGGSPYTITVSNATGGTFNAANYTIGYVSGALTVNPASLTITANNTSKTYGQTVTFAGTEFTPTGLQNSETVGSVSLSSLGAGATAGVSGSPYSIVASNATGGTFNAANYTIGYVNGALTVNPASLTITANSTSKTYGQTVTFAGTEFTPTGLQNSETVGSVSLSSLGAGATAGVSGSPYTITASNATGGTFNAANYTIGYVSGALTINPASLTITANNATKTYGQTVTFAGTEFTPTGLQNSETVGSVSLSSLGAGATAGVSGSPYTITVSNATGGTFNAANYTIGYVSGALTINPASLTITANSTSKSYGQTVTFAGTEFTPTGLQNSETVGSVSLSSLGAGATAGVSGSPYTITASNATGGTFNAANYTIGYVSGALTINPASLTITANNATKTYGQTVTFAGTEFTPTGLQNSETVGSVSLSSLGAGATAGVSGSPYTITASNATGGTFNAANYTIGYVSGALTINPASLTITANNTSKSYGQTVTFAGTEFTPTGLQNSETVGSVSLSSLGAGATAGVSGSPYTITVSNATGGTFNAANYTIGYVNGALTVNPASLTITANNTSKTYGQTVTFAGTEFTPTGLQNSETVGSVSLSSLGAGATAGVSGSPYSIVASNATGGTFNAANYTIGYVSGALTINPASLTITANSTAKSYGQTVTFAGTEFTPTGLKNGETVGSVSLSSLGAGATAGVSGSPYTITASNAAGGTFNAANYTIGYVSGALTINPASLTITANSTAKSYGQTVTFTGAEFTPTGLQNSETVGSVSLSSLGAGATAGVSGSPYSIVASNATGGTFNAANYTIGYVNGALTVNPASLTITANSTSKSYGQTVTFAGTEFTPTGLKNGETVGSVSLSSLGAGATAGVSGSPYTITASNATGGTFNAANYTIGYVSGALTINPASLTITANNATKTYGQTVTFAGTEFTPTGLKNGETVGTVLLSSLGAGATAGVSGSPYTITASNATGGTFNAANYTIGYVSGALTINPASLTITANNATKTYGQTVTFAGTEFTPTGLQNSETVGSASLSSLGAAATAGVSGSPYNIAASNATGGTFNPGNYNINYINGNLTIVPAALRYIADSASRSVGAPNPVFAGTTSGYVLGDSQVTVTTGTLQFNSVASNTSRPGRYAINGFGLIIIGANYTLEQATSNTTALTVTADNSNVVIPPVDESIGNIVFSTTYQPGQNMAVKVEPSTIMVNTVRDTSSSPASIGNANFNINNNRGMIVQPDGSAGFSIMYSKQLQ